MALALMVDCRSGATERGGAVQATASQTAADAEAVTPTDAAASLPPLPPDPLFTNLGPGEGGTDVVSVPNGATSPRPVLIVLHGAGDRPDWNCDAWRHITGAQGFVLCPRGDYVPAESTPGDRRYTIRGGAPLRAHLDEALGTLGERFAGYIDDERPLAAGFSLGATEIAQIAIAHPERFSRVALLEGGHGVWTPKAIRSFADGGGRRVLFGCGSSWCLGPAEDAAKRLRAGGVEARVVHANVGHTNDRPLQEAIMGELGWYLDGDARWAPQP
jgi:predicted esterase